MQNKNILKEGTKFTGVRPDCTQTISMFSHVLEWKRLSSLLTQPFVTHAEVTFLGLFKNYKSSWLPLRHLRLP